MMGERVYALIGEAIRRHREVIGMTQSTLGTHMGLSRTSVTNIEHGRQPLTIVHLYRAADALGVPVGEIMPSEAPVVRKRAVRPSPEFRALLGRLSSLPEAEPS